MCALPISTDSAVVPWAMVFREGGPIARHPSQLYEELLEGVVLFVVLHIMVRRGELERTGLVSGAFLIGYGIARIVAEFFRARDPFLSFVLTGPTLGQVSSTPLLLGGFVVTSLWLHPKA